MTARAGYRRHRARPARARRDSSKRSGQALTPTSNGWKAGRIAYGETHAYAPVIDLICRVVGIDAATPGQGPRAAR